MRGSNALCQQTVDHLFGSHKEKLLKILELLYMKWAADVSLFSFLCFLDEIVRQKQIIIFAEYATTCQKNDYLFVHNKLGNKG